MKKLIIGLAFTGIFSFLTPIMATPVPGQPECDTVIITCCDGSQHMAMVCQQGDYEIWVELLCPTCD